MFRPFLSSQRWQRTQRRPTPRSQPSTPRRFYSACVRRLPVPTGLRRLAGIDAGTAWIEVFSSQPRHGIPRLERLPLPTALVEIQDSSGLLQRTSGRAGRSASDRCTDGSSSPRADHRQIVTAAIVATIPHRTASTAGSALDQRRQRPRPSLRAVASAVGTKPTRTPRPAPADSFCSGPCMPSSQNHLRPRRRRRPRTCRPLHDLRARRPISRRQDRLRLNQPFRSGPEFAAARRPRLHAAAPHYEPTVLRGALRRAGNSAARIMSSFKEIRRIFEKTTT